MIYGVEANAKFANFEGVLRLNTLLQILYALPVLIRKLGIVVGQESWSLDPGKRRLHQRVCSVLPVVQVKVDSSGTSVVGILNYFLCRKLL